MGAPGGQQGGQPDQMNLLMQVYEVQQAQDRKLDAIARAMAKASDVRRIAGGLDMLQAQVYNHERRLVNLEYADKVRLVLLAAMTFDILLLVVALRPF